MIRFHWQNLNEDRRGRVKGLPWHGRAWLRFGDVNDSHSRRVEWVLGWPRSIRAMLDLDANDDSHVTLGISFLVATLYLSATVPYRHWFRRLLPRNEGRSIGFYIDGNSLHVSLWEPEGSWSRSNPKWWSTHVFLDDFFLGEAKHSEVVLEARDALIPLPEKNYQARVEIVEASWARPRWFTKKLLRFHVEIPDGIPIPGKGENSWDCGDDATYGLTATGSTVSEAVAKVVASILRTRERRAGLGWTPSMGRRAT